MVILDLLILFKTCLHSVTNTNTSATVVTDFFHHLFILSFVICLNCISLIRAQWRWNYSFHSLDIKWVRECSIKSSDEQKCRVVVGVSFQTFRAWPFISEGTRTLESSQRSFSKIPWFVRSIISLPRPRGRSQRQWEIIEVQDTDHNHCNERRQFSISIMFCFLKRY